MAFDKVWIGGTSSVYSLAANWKPISIRNSVYRWTASGSGTNEFYLELAAGGDPGLTEPASVQANGSDMMAGTVGSLTAGQWDWGDNDTLGFSTVYVRLSDGADPDSGTSFECGMAFALGLPIIAVRTDFRGGGDDLPGQQLKSVNLMLSQAATAIVDVRDPAATPQEVAAAVVRALSDLRTPPTLLGLANR